MPPKRTIVNKYSFDPAGTNLNTALDHRRTDTNETARDEGDARDRANNENMSPADVAFLYEKLLIAGARERCDGRESKNRTKCRPMKVQEWKSTAPKGEFDAL